LRQLANERRNALSALSDLGGERTIKLAVKKEFPVLGLEAHRIGGQHIDAEIWREPQNVFAIALRDAVIAPHAPSMRGSTRVATNPGCHCKARGLGPSSRSRAGITLARYAQAEERPQWRSKPVRPGIPG
jgi:hypothetical protein